nr:uncharacterized protein [uncultured bacterium]
MFDGAGVADAAHAAPDDAAKSAIPVVPLPVQVRAADPAKDDGRREVAFIDTSVADYQQLVDGVRAGVEVDLIDGGQSGLAQMAAWAETHSGYDAIHILSHGSEATLLLGTDTVTEATLSNAATQAELALIGHSLKAGGDLLFYGCDIAKGPDGAQFIADLAAATGADVAASTDATGAVSKTGNWTLESANGAVEASAFVIPGYQYRLASGTLTFTGSTGFADKTVTDGDGGSTDISGITININAILSNGSVDNSLTPTYHDNTSDPGYPSEVSFSWTAGYYGISIKSSSTSVNFSLTSLKFLDWGWEGNSYAIRAYDDGSSVGNAVTFASNTTGTMLNVSRSGGSVTIGTDFNNIDEVRVYAISSSAGSNLGYISFNDIVIGDPIVPGPTVSAASPTAYTDTSANDTFGNTTGTISATANSGSITGYGISGSSTGSYLSGAYDRSKAGTYGTLYVNSTSGAYAYVPTSDATLNAATATVTDAFTIQATDGGGTAGNTLTITINGVNDTPVLSAPSSASYTDTSASDTFSNTTGTLSASDRDTGAAQTYGISTGTTGGNTNVGGTVYDVSKAGTYGTLYVKSSTGEYVYVPTSNAVLNALTASTTDTFTVTASDGSLSDTKTYTVNLTGANDAPTASAGSKTINEDTAGAFAVADFSFSDADTGNTLQGIQVTTAPGTGTLWVDTDGSGTVNGAEAALIANDTVSYANINGGLLKFLGASNGNGSPYTTYAFKVYDGTAYSSSAYTMTVNLTAVNDAPTSAAGSKSGTEDTNLTFTSGDFTFTDVDSGDTLQGIKVTGIPSTGTLWVDSDSSGTVNGAESALANNGTVTTANIAKLTYKPVADANGAKTFDFQVYDGTAYSSSSYTMTMNIAAANDVPVVDLDGSTGGYNYTNTFAWGGSAANVANSNATLTDVDSTNLSSLTVTIGNLLDTTNESLSSTYGTGSQTVNSETVSIGTYNSGTGALTISGSASVATYQLVLRSIQYNNVAGSPNTTDRSITAVANDGSANSTEGATTTMSVRFAPIVDLNGATSGTGYSGSFTEDGGAVSIVSSGATLTDDGSDPDITGATITLSNAQTGDSLSLSGHANGSTYSGISVTYTSSSLITLAGSGNKADYLTLMKEAQFNNSSHTPNTTARTIDFVATDKDSNTGPAATATISVAAVNDAPTLGTNAGKTLNEGATATIAAAQLALSDLDSPASSTLSYTLTTAPTRGTLWVDANSNSTLDSGEALAVNGTFTQSDIAASKLKYTHDGGETTSDSFGFSYTDGTATAVTGNTFSITVTPVNDSPSVTPGSGGVFFTSSAVTVAPSLTLADVDSTNLNRAVVTITNPQDGASETLSSTYGTGAQTVNGETVTFTLSNSDHTMTVSGTASKATYALALKSIQFNDSAGTPNSTQRTISFQVRDDSADAATQDSSTVNRTLDINHAPTAAGGTLSPPNGQVGTSYTYPLPANTFTDQDSGDTIAYSASGLPAGLSINSGTGAISGNPTLAGTYNVTITATDSRSATASKTAAILVNSAPVASPPPPPPPPPPVAQPAPPPPTPLADAPPPVVTIVRDAAPPVQTFTNTTSDGPGTSKAPDASTTSSSGFKVSLVSDSARPSGSDALIAVKPAVQIDSSASGRVSFTLAADTFAHTRADAVVNLTAGQANGQALPSWLSFNPKTGTFVGTPPPGATGEVVVRVIARDQDGREAVAVIRLNIGGGAVQQQAPEGEGQPQNTSPEGEGQPQQGPAPEGEKGPEPQDRGAFLENSRPDGVPGVVRMSGFAHSRDTGKPPFSAELRMANRFGVAADRQAALLAAARQVARHA